MNQTDRQLLLEMRQDIKALQKDINFFKGIHAAISVIGGVIGTFIISILKGETHA